MIVIGLTGGMASGKTSVAKMLSRLGAHVIDADAIAKELVAPGQEALQRLAEIFGQRIILSDGNLDRGALAAIVFNDHEKLEQLNAVLHPLVIQKTVEKLRSIKETEPDAVVVIDAPLLLEAGMAGLVDEIWVVAAGEEEQIQRAALRDKLSREEASKRLAVQMPLKEKLKHAHRVIDNSGSLASTAEQVKRLWEKVILSGCSNKRNIKT
ncbi:MAG: dephospho-CoA kinase [Bacillota bacterium]